MAGWLLSRRKCVFGPFFDVLGAKPIAGRTFLADDDHPTPNVVVLSEGFWRSQFAGDPALVGRAIRLDGEPFTVVGIVAPGTAGITCG